MNRQTTALVVGSYFLDVRTFQKASDILKLIHHYKFFQTHNHHFHHSTKRQQQNKRELRKLIVKF